MSTQFFVVLMIVLTLWAGCSVAVAWLLNTDNVFTTRFGEGKTAAQKLLLIVVGPFALAVPLCRIIGALVMGAARHYKYRNW